MILAERAFEQARTALECQRRPARHPVNLPFGRQVSDSEIEVADHLLHHELTRISSLVKFLIVRRKRTIDPRYVPVIAHFVKIEISPEKARQSFVFEPHAIVGAVGGVLQEKIDVAQLFPFPGARRGRHGTVAQHLARKRIAGNNVGCLIVNGGPGGEDRIEIIRVKLALLLGMEKFVRRKPVFRETVECILATAETARRHTGQ